MHSDSQSPNPPKLIDPTSVSLDLNDSSSCWYAQVDSQQGYLLHCIGHLEKKARIYNNRDL